MPSQWLKSLSHKAAQVRMLQPVYHASLNSLTEDLNFDHYPPDLFPGDAGRGRWITMGHCDINGYRVPIDTEKWFIGTQWEETPFFNKIHSFEFLLELKALGGDVGRKCARNITSEWLTRFHKFNTSVWDVTLTAKRLYHWMVCYPYVFETAAEEFLREAQNTFYQQYQHLKNVIAHKPNLENEKRFYALWALLIVQCHAPDLADEVEYQSFMQLLKGAVEDMALPDNGIRYSRNLNDVIDCAKAFCILLQSLQMAGRDIPLWLSKRCETLTKLVNTLTHTDKDILNFQGGTVPRKNDIEKLARLSNLRVRHNDKHFDNFGYTILRKGRTSVAIDHGKGEHKSPLAFEMAYAGQRMIVSCGTYTLNREWRDGLEGMAAHSGLCVGDKEPFVNGKIQSSLELMNGAALFSGTQDGYKSSCDTLHTRRLYLDSKGEDLRGEDVLVRHVAISSVACIARYHLHPNVKASLTKGNQSVLLKLPSGVGWIFQCNKGEVLLDESVYCADGLHIRKSSQIIVHFDIEDVATTFKWAIKKA